MAPEDEVINPSSLTKFRKLRLKDMNLLDMLIAKTVQLEFKCFLVYLDCHSTLYAYFSIEKTFSLLLHYFTE